MEALPHWPYVLNIITRLSCAVDLRNAIIQAESTLLGELVNRAAQTNSGSNKYTQTCVALLSHPLPDKATLPLDAQTLLIRLFERAVTHPEAANIRPIYQFINGAGRDLIGILPFDVLSRLEEHLFTILAVPTGVEDQSLGLYCLAVMKIILQEFNKSNSSTPEDFWPSSDSLSPDSPLRPKTTWNPDAIGQFFEGRKTHKTMQLVGLRVVCACRPGSEDANSEALTSVMLANEVVTAVADTVRAEWCAKNPAIVRKLLEKCLAPDLMPDLRFEVLAFIGALPCSIALPVQAIKFYGRLVLDTEHLSIPQEQYDRSLDLSLHRYAPLLDQSWWQHCLGTILDAPNSALPSMIVQSGSRCSSLLDRLTVLVERSPLCRGAVLNAFSTYDIRQKFDDLVASKTASHADNTSENICVSTMMSIKEALTKSICTLLLRCVLSSQPQETELPNHLISSALHRHSKITDTGSCTHRNRLNAHPHHPPLLVEVRSTPVKHDATMHWRDRLALGIQAQAKTQEQALLASFAEICRDLEDRCENIEGPLREERKNAVNLESRYNNLAAAYSDLESQILDRDLRINALEADNDRHSAEMDTAATESQALLRRIDQAARELQESREHACNALEAARQKSSELDMEHATTLACKQETVDRLREQAQTSEQEAQHLRDQLEHTREQAQTSKREVQHLRTELERITEGHKQDATDQARLEGEVNDSAQRLREKEDQLSRFERDQRVLAEKKAELDQETEGLRKQVERQQREKEILEVTLEDTAAHSKDEIRKVTASFEDTMTRTKQEWMSIRENLERQLESAQQELTKAEEGLQEQHLTSKQKVLDMRKKVR